jgi:Tfp pilus assembly protein PilX
MPAMTQANALLRNENGSIIVVGVLLLTLLTVIGLSASRTSTTEVQITTNAQNYQMAFYVADSGWKEGALWLDDQAAAPLQINTTGDVVRNFGGGAADVLNDTFPDGTEDRVVEQIPYWYQVTYLSDQRAPGNDSSYRRFNYGISSIADRTQQIDVRISKVCRVGY